MSATHDGAFIMVYDVSLLEFILTGGGVVLHNQRRGLPILIINYEFYLIIIIGWLYMLGNDLTEGTFIFLVVTMVLVLLEQPYLLWVLVLFTVSAGVEISGIPLFNCFLCLLLNTAVGKSVVGENLCRFP